MTSWQPPPGFSPNYMYPGYNPNQQFMMPPMMPMPTNLKEYKEHLKVLKKSRQFFTDFEKEIKDKSEEKKEEKKKSIWSKAELWVLISLMSPIIVPVYILGIVLSLKLALGQASAILH